MGATLAATRMITVDMMASRNDRARFMTEWPDGAELTLANVLRAQNLNFEWVYERRRFTPKALKRYVQAVSKALKIREIATAPLRETLEVARDAAWAAYYEAHMAAKKEEDAFVTRKVFGLITVRRRSDAFWERQRARARGVYVIAPDPCHEVYVKTKEPAEEQWMAAYSPVQKTFDEAHARAWLAAALASPDFAVIGTEKA